MGLTAGSSAGPAGSTWAKFRSAAAFQKALWWYNGAQAAGVLAMPPVLSAAQLARSSLSAAALRELFGGTPDNGTAAAHPVGPIASTPTLFVCGEEDSAILCDHPYALSTAAHVSAPYSYLKVACGHELLACSHAAATGQVEEAIVALIGNHSLVEVRGTSSISGLSR